MEVKFRYKVRIKWKILETQVYAEDLLTVLLRSFSLAIFF